VPPWLAAAAWVIGDRPSLLPLIRRANRLRRHLLGSMNSPGGFCLGI
jgi:hypothetical protein